MTDSMSEQGRALNTVPKFCLAAIAKHAKPDALNTKRAGEWQHIPAETFVNRVRYIALGLAELGIRAGDRVALLSENYWATGTGSSLLLSGGIRFIGEHIAVDLAGFGVGGQSFVAPYVAFIYRW